MSAIWRETGLRQCTVTPLSAYGGKVNIGWINTQSQQTQSSKQLNDSHSPIKYTFEMSTKKKE